MNALGAQPTSGTPRFPAVEPGDVAVLVRTAGLPDATGDDPPGKELDLEDEWVRDKELDLASVNLETGAVSRIATSALVRDYDFSPDGAAVAWTVLAGFEKNTQQSNFDLVVFDLATGAARTLAEGIRMSYGIEWSWGPDSRRVAWFPSGREAAGADGAEIERLVVVNVASGARRSSGGDAPGLASGEGEAPPLWSADGGVIYGIGGGELWRVDVDSGAAASLAPGPLRSATPA